MNAQLPSNPNSSTARSRKTHTSRTPKERFISRVLDPIDRLVEAIYAVLIVLTFTLATRAVQSQHVVESYFDSSKLLLNLFLAAGGCAVAWGLIDGAMYVLTCLFERGQDRRLYRLIRDAASEEEAIALLADELDDEMGSLASSTERREIYAALYARLRSSPPPNVGFEKADFAGGLGVLLVAVGAALPVLLPLILLPGSIEFRVRASNFVAFTMLFLMGYRWGQYAGGRPWLSGLLLLVLGVMMMIVAIPLGG